MQGYKYFPPTCILSLKVVKKDGETSEKKKKPLPKETHQRNLTQTKKPSTIKAKTPKPRDCI